MEQARRDKAREQAVEWDRAEQEHSKFPRLRKIWDSSGEWEEGWVSADPARAAVWVKAVIVRTRVFRTNVEHSIRIYQGGVHHARWR
jgi:hypothetical protein